MSSSICVKILKYQCIPKKFPLLCRQFFQFITLEQTIFFSQLQLANNFFFEKVTPPIKNNGPSLTNLTIVNKRVTLGLSMSLRSHTKHLFHVFRNGLKTFERDKGLGFASTFISFSCFHTMMKHWNSCFIYYLIFQQLDSIGNNVS